MVWHWNAFAFFLMAEAIALGVVGAIEGLAPSAAEAATVLEMRDVQIQALKQENKALNLDYLRARNRAPTSSRLPSAGMGRFSATQAAATGRATGARRAAATVQR